MPGPFLGLAHALVALGQYEPALRALLDALHTRTRRAEVLVLLREVLEQTHQMDGLFYLQRYEAGDLTRQELILSLTDPKQIEKVVPGSGEHDLNAMILALEDELGIERNVDDAKEIELVETFLQRFDASFKEDENLRSIWPLPVFNGFVVACGDNIRILFSAPCSVRGGAKPGRRNATSDGNVFRGVAAFQLHYGMPTYSPPWRSSRTTV